MPFMLKAVLLLLVALPLAAQSEDAFVAWALTRATPLDFRKLDRAISEARLIGVGESVHEVDTFLGFRRELLEHLVRRHRVTALVMESGMPEAMAIDDYANGRATTIDYATAMPGTGSLDEVRRTMDWLRAWNLGEGRKRPVAVYGADFPESSGSIVPALDRLQQLTTDADVRAAIDALRPLATQIAGKWWRGAGKKYDALPVEEKALLTENANVLVARTRNGSAWVQRLALLVQQYESSLRLGMFSPNAPRDVALADNTLWALGRIGRDERAVYWAHNAHVQRAPVKGPALPPGSWPGSGTRFANALGNRYFAIGTAYGGPSLDEKTPPEEGSVDAALAKVGAKPFLLVLRASKRPAWIDVERPMRFQVKHLTVPLGGFDAVVFFDEVSRMAR
jgi:erythromycin esterase